MRKILTLLAVIMSLAFTSQGQMKTGKISGVIKDGNQKTIQAATIMLLKAADSSVVKLSVADKDGNFQFEGIPEGQYLVSVTAIGHTKEYSPNFDISEAGENVDLKTIELVPEVKSLQGVTITSKKPFIEQKIDRMVVNVEAAVSNVGTSALEVLEKSPGVTVDKDGNISLKGKQGVQVYIDGRPSYLSGADLANMLKNMSSSQLDQIELMTNPPAKYDAAGNSGIINIKTKKTKQFGYSGSISSTWSQGRYPKVSESVNFNYRKNKVNIFTNLGYSNRKNFQNLDIQRKFIEFSSKELKSRFDQESRIIESGKSYNAKLGLDYNASKNTTLGFVLNGFYNPGVFGNHSDVFISDPNNILLSETKASTSNNRKWENFSSNINMRHVFDSTGTELTMDADYLNYTSTNAQDLVNAYYDQVGMPTYKADTLLGHLPQDISIYSYKADFSKPLKNGAKFEAGVKTSYVKTDNNAIYDSLNYGVLVPDLGRSNHFIYKENVNAAYANFSRPLSKKVFAQLGLRVENTHAQGDQVTSNEKFDRKYTQLFPTAYIQYTVNDKNSFVINYGRRINRPDYSDLNPFIMFLDKYTFEQGNPNLKPQFAHNIELSHTYKGFLTTTLNYNKTTDIITDVLEQNTDKNETFIRKQNVASQRQYGISVAGGGPIKKWWSMNVWLNAYNNLYEGVVNGDNISLGATTGQANISNQFKFDGGWSAELSGFYTTPMVEGVFEVKGFGMMNMGVSKQVLNKKGTIRFSVRDLLNTQKIRGTSQFSNIDAAFQQTRDSRQFAIGFSYRFSKGKAASAPKRKIGGADTEQNRVKVDGN
ncbi:MAG: TonB-dependent receptor [Terrimonas sp.]|nr:TonB-dependent receptor [Terrimonas sp.]